MQKSEIQKMRDGEPFYAFDPEIQALRSRAQKLTFKLNQSIADGSDERRELLAQLFASIGERCHIEANFHCDYGVNISIGTGFYANFNLTILDLAKVTIGEDVLFAPNVQLYTAYHPLEPQARAALEVMAKPITIGNRVWLGGGVIVLPGVTIGDNSVIGAGSVVTKDIPHNSVACGNPCKVVRQI